MPSEDRHNVDLTSGLEEGRSAIVLGRYHLLQKIGEGGMGEVWLAEQKEPVRRRVALKLVKAGMNSREVLARFESERQALALMDHPAISKVLDAGSTPDGAPYFVMEYIAGVPITTYCDNHRLSTRDRLELFMHVCEGVQHAHQKAIIHRDLKPSNVLVTEVDGKGAPKIIDFGVAKALTQKLTADTIFTRVGTMIGTPEYMSPEQALSAGEDIDTRTDVYSLGTIFYELLAGTPPIDLRRAALDEFLRRLREEEPPKPSTRIRTRASDTSLEVARRRQSEPLALEKQMRGDLDSIALKALEKDRARRYGSPSDMAADIARYLRNEAVLAVPPSAAYRARKFALRYRAALVTAAAFALVLILAAAISIAQSVRATRQRDRADREAAVAQAVNDFLRNDLLAQASAYQQSGAKTKPDPDLKVRTALDRAAARIPGKFDRQPEVEAGIRETIGLTYADLGLYAEARLHLQRAVDSYRRALGAENPKTLAATRALGANARDQGAYPESEKLLTDTLATQRRVLGAEHPETLVTMLALGSLYTLAGKSPQAEALDAQLLEIRRRVSGREHPDTLKVMNNLALDYQDEGKYEQAEALFRDLVEIRRRVLGPDHPDTAKTINNLRRVLGPDHPDLTMNMNNLVVIDVEQGKYETAETLAKQVVEMRRRLLGPEHPDTLQSLHNLAWVEYKQGRYAESEAVYTQTVDLRRRVLGPEHPKTLLSERNLADLYLAQGRYGRAEALLTDVVEISRRVRGADHPDTLGALGDLGGVYQAEGKYAQAETCRAEAFQGYRRRLGPEHSQTMNSAADLVLVYLSQGKFTESEALAREIVEVHRKKNPDAVTRFRAESLLGATLAGQKKYAEAEPLLLDAYDGLLRKSRIGVPDKYELDQAREWIVKMYQSSGRPAKAAEWRRK